MMNVLIARITIYLKQKARRNENISMVAKTEKKSAKEIHLAFGEVLIT